MGTTKKRKSRDEPRQSANHPKTHPSGKEATAFGINPLDEDTREVMDEPCDGGKSTPPSLRPAAAPLDRLRLLQAGGVPLARSVSNCLHETSRACQVGVLH
eukprot:scaffold143873_cov41-Prasinocladus_malaysianus.AAC.1